MATTTEPAVRGNGARPIRKVKRPGPPILRFYSSAVGKKWVMGITGLILLSFLLVHLLGNIKLFLSKEDLNLYGEALRDMPGHLLPHTWLLWAFRLGLIAAFFFHIHAAYGLTIINHKARGDRQMTKRDYIAADWASRTMRWTGVIILFYLFFHLADLTWGPANPEFLRGDPYNNLIYSLQRPIVAITYSLAMIALGFHLYHGLWSMFQTLGINNPKINPIRRPFAITFAGILMVGNLMFPIAVQAHWVEPECPGAPPTLPCKVLDGELS